MLQPKIDTQLQAFTVSCFADNANISNSLAVQVLDEAFLTGNTVEAVIELHFYTRSAGAVDIGSSYQLRNNLTCRVKTAVLTLTVDPGNTRREDNARNGWRLMPSEVHELLISIAVELSGETVNR